MCIQFLGEAINLGILFTGMQMYEYGSLTFFISSSAFGSVFFMLTGFHGFHVLIGTVFLIVCRFRVQADHFLTKYHIGFVCALWYWHFVDVVWIALFWIVYVWGRYMPYHDLWDAFHFVNFLGIVAPAKLIVRFYFIDPHIDYYFTKYTK